MSAMHFSRQVTARRAWRRKHRRVGVGGERERTSAAAHRGKTAGSSEDSTLGEWSCFPVPAYPPFGADPTYIT